MQEEQPGIHDTVWSAAKARRRGGPAPRAAGPLASGAVELVRVGAGAVVPTQRADRLDVLAGKLEVEDVDVLPDAGRRNGLGEDDVAALDVPAQHHLSRGLADPAGDRGDRRVAGDGAPGQRRPRLDGDLVLATEPPHVILGEVGVD